MTHINTSINVADRPYVMEYLHRHYPVSTQSILNLLRGYPVVDEVRPNRLTLRTDDGITIYVRPATLDSGDGPSFEVQR